MSAFEDTEILERRARTSAQIITIVHIPVADRPYVWLKPLTKEQVDSFREQGASFTRIIRYHEEDRVPFEKVVFHYSNDPAPVKHFGEEWVFDPATNTCRKP